jgi:uncharacterized membrane protein (GlpM family)
VPPYDPLLLAAKMAIAATIVVSVSIIAEKTKPFIAAMVATLPVSAGPALVFLALDHDDAFMRSTLIGALVQNTATGIYCLTYGYAARHLGTALSLLAALAAWAMSGLISAGLGLGLWSAIAAALILYPLLIRLARPMLAAPMPPVPPRPWYAIPMRAALVATLVATVTSLSFVLGPYTSGLLAVFPIVMTSLVLILQPRIGGPATANVLVSGLPGLLGFAVALWLGALLVAPLGRYIAIFAVILGCILWNGALVLWRQRRRTT